MSIEAPMAAATVGDGSKAAEAVPFYRQLWFLMASVFASWFLWPLAIIPAIAVWTGPVHFYWMPGKRIENITAAKIAFSALCVIYMAWFGLKAVGELGVPGCSDQRTTALVDQIIREKYFGTFEGRAAVFNVFYADLPPSAFEGHEVSLIRTVDTIPANNGFRCEAHVRLPVTAHDGVNRVYETTLYYTVEPVDRSSQIYVQVQFGRIRF